MKLSDCIVGQLADWGVLHIFRLTGGAMHLDDSIGEEPCIQYVCNHYKQPSAINAFSEREVSRSEVAARGGCHA